MNNTVRMTDVDFSYRSRPILQGVSWEVGDGVTALLGPNGAGKTTLIKCLVGIYQVARGEILISGRPIQAEKGAARQVGYVPQNPVLPALAKVKDVVSYAAWLSGLSSSDIPSAVDSALAAMDVTELAGRRIRSLSGGQRQRVALATGVVHDPAVLVLDEPTVGLDPGQRLRVRGVIQEIGRTRPVILSTHMTEDVQHLADSVGILVGGSIRYSGTIEDLSSVISSQAQDGRPGSAFERSYDDLMAQFGERE